MCRGGYPNEARVCPCGTSSMKTLVDTCSNDLRKDDVHILYTLIRETVLHHPLTRGGGGRSLIVTVGGGGRERCGGKERCDACVWPSLCLQDVAAMTEEEQLALALQMSMSAGLMEAGDMQAMETDHSAGSEQVCATCTCTVYMHVHVLLRNVN